MAAPKVQTLDQLIGSTNSIYNPQRQLYQQQIGAAQDAGQQQEQALYGVQKNAFKDIAQMAANKGMLFSGFTPDQQAQYNADKFMPALTDLRAKVQNNIAQLQSALVGLDTEQRKNAMSTQQNQLDKLYNFNQTMDDRKWQEQQSKVAYDREMAKLRQQQSFQAAQPQKVSESQQKRSDASALYTEMSKLAGGDGYVSPQTYARGLQIWQKAGYTQKDYDALFSGLRNPANGHYRLSTGWGA